MDMEQGKTILRYSEENGSKLEWYSKEVQMKFPTVSYSPVKINDDIMIQKIKMAGSMGCILAGRYALHAFRRTEK